MNDKPSPKKPAKSMDIRRVKKRPVSSSHTSSKAAISKTTKTKKTAKKQPKNSRLWRILSGPLHGHPFIVPVTTFIVLSFVAMGGYIISNGSTLGPTDTKLVYLSVDDEEQTVPTRAKTVKELLERLDIEVTKDDIVQPALDAEISLSEQTVQIYKARPITIVDGDNEVTLVAAGPTPREAVERAGIEIYPEDKLEAHTEVVETEDVVRGQPVADRFIIERATPVNISLYGSLIPSRTHNKTVGEAISERNIVTQADDVITPSPDTLLKENMQIFITPVGTKVETVDEIIEMPEQIIEDPTTPQGTTVVRSQGRPGRTVVVYQLGVEDGEVVSRKVLQKIMAVEPVKQVVVKGTKPPTIIVAGDHAALMTAAGIPVSEHGSAEFIISRESGWRLNASNAGGCLGLGQACPGSKLINACPNYANDATCQLRFFSGYVNNRYGGWNGAYNFWAINHWY